MRNPSQVEFGLNLQVHRLNFLIDTLTNATLKEYKLGISNSQYLILKTVYILKNPSQTEIADYMRISTAAVTRHCLNLQQKKLITVLDLDRRTHVVELTKEGEVVFTNTAKLLQSELRAKIDNYDELCEALAK